MPRLSIWNSGRKGATFNYIDKQISQWMGASGTAVYVHKYLGHHDQEAPNPQNPRPAPSVTSIQDVLFLENRDRKYSDEVFELRGVYNVNDIDFDLRQFGFFLQNDTMFIEFHLNDMLAQIGRKLLSGDVLELPHMRDDALLDEGKAINKFYTVEDVNRASDGYSPTWFPHILRVKCAPMAAAEEYSDILDKQAKDPFQFDSGRLKDLMTTIAKEESINEEIVESAIAQVGGRNFETRHYYVMPGDETTSQKPWIFAGDGVPPNGHLATNGNSFPSGPNEGDYHFREDYTPSTLFRFQEGAWRIQEYDYRESEWSAAHSTLKRFINNRKTVTFEDGETKNQRTGLYQAVKPKADF